MTARIEVRLHAELTSEFVLDGQRVTIGRSPECEICLDGPAVSERHALIVDAGGEFVLTDLGSASGTLVDGIDVDEHVLEHADVIGVGEHELTYTSDEQVLRSVEDESVFDLAPIDDGVFVEINAPLATVEALNGPGAGKKLELKRARIALGIPGVQVVMITRGPSGYLLKGSKGTTPVVNGANTEEQASKLKDRDVIELAGTRLRFEFVAGPDAR